MGPDLKNSVLTETNRMTLCWGSKRKGKNVYGKNQPDAGYRSKSTVYLKEKIWYYVSSRSELCAQTRASSLAGGMPVW